MFLEHKNYNSYDFAFDRQFLENRIGEGDRTKTTGNSGKYFELRFSFRHRVMTHEMVQFIIIKGYVLTYCKIVTDH